MHVPDEFRSMAERFHQDVFAVTDGLPDLAGYVVEQLTERQKKNLRIYLSEIISHRYSDEQLQNIWDGTSAEVGFSEGLREILTIIRDHIDRRI